MFISSVLWGVGLTLVSGFQFFYLAAGMVDYEIDDANSEPPQSDAPHYAWQYFAVTNHATKGGAKNVI